MTEAITNFLSNALGDFFQPEIIVFIISMLPILELRGGMIAATLLGIPWTKAMIICIIGNMIPIPFIIFFIRRILNFLQEHGPIKRFAKWIENKAMKRGREMEAKYPKFIQLGLFLFVAIPIPGTGAWTGSLVAVLLGISPKRSLPPILLGVLGASLVMSLFTYLIPAMVG